MASSTWHTIALQGAAVRREGLAGASGIKPGHLLYVYTDEALRVHVVAAGVLPGKLIALESPTAAAGTTAAIDTAYASGDTVYYADGQPGDVYYMLLKSGETVVKGITQLVSAGDGTLQAATVDANTLEGAVVGVAEEDLTASGIVRVRVRIT